MHFRADLGTDRGDAGSPARSSPPSLPRVGPGQRATRRQLGGIATAVHISVLRGYARPLDGRRDDAAHEDRFGHLWSAGLGGTETPPDCGPRHRMASGISGSSSSPRAAGCGPPGVRVVCRNNRFASRRRLGGRVRRRPALGASRKTSEKAGPPGGAAPAATGKAGAQLRDPQLQVPLRCWSTSAGPRPLRSARLASVRSCGPRPINAVSAA
jgi:hypothetical protein